MFCTIWLIAAHSNLGSYYPGFPLQQLCVERVFHTAYFAHLVNCSTLSTNLDHFLNPAHSSYYPGFPLNISIIVVYVHAERVLHSLVPRLSPRGTLMGQGESLGTRLSVLYLPIVLGTIWK